MAKPTNKLCYGNNMERVLRPSPVPSSMAAGLPRR